MAVVAATWLIKAVVPNIPANAIAIAAMNLIPFFIL
jgi:hypothetical protein